MKKISLAILAGTLMFTSCKKGENDPSISLVSRKARVAGEWNVDKNVSVSTTTGSSYVTVNEETFDGTSYSRKQTSTPISGGTSTTNTITGTVALNKMTFEKEGTFKQELTYTTVETESFTGYTETTTTTYTQVFEGSWNFLGKVDEFANKERIVLNFTKFSDSEKIVEVETYTGLPSTTTTSESTTSGSIADGEISQVWALDRLASDEMVVKGTEDNKNSSSYTSGSTTTTYSSTTTGTMEITLSQE